MSDREDYVLSIGANGTYRYWKNTKSKVKKTKRWKNARKARKLLFVNVLLEKVQPSLSCTASLLINSTDSNETTGS